MKRTIPPCARWSNLLATNSVAEAFRSRAAFSYVDRIAAVVRAEDDVLYLIGEPDCWGADDSSVLHSLFQFFAFDEGLCGFDGGKFVGHCDVVGVVDRLVHSLSRNALRFLDRGEIVVNLAPSLVV
jgi:hypothetical protein